MIFDNNTAYQTYRILISIFGTLGMVVSISRIKENKKKNLLIVGGYVVYAVLLMQSLFPSSAYDFRASCLFCAAP